MKRQWLNTLSEHERTGYSQAGEEGIIEWIFDNIGAENFFCVEFGAKDGRTQSNTGALVDKGWNHLLMDCDATADHVKNEFVTAENINGLFDKYGVPEVIDLLAIDIDGNDYWVWKAIDRLARVVIIECNPQFHKGEAKTIKYNPDHVWEQNSYYGASPLALKRLAESKGMKMIWTNRLNCIFVADYLLPEDWEYNLDYVETRGWPPCKDESKEWVDVD